MAIFISAIKNGYIPLDFADDTPKQELTLLDQVNVCIDVAKTLVALHRQGIVHRDVKPANILLEVDVEKKCTGNLSDFDLTEFIGASEQNGKYFFWDRCGQAGFTTPFADLYGLIMTLGLVFFPAFENIYSDIDEHLGAAERGKTKETLLKPYQDNSQNDPQALLAAKSALEIIIDGYDKDHSAYDYLAKSERLKIELDSSSLQQRQAAISELTEKSISGEELLKRLEAIKKVLDNTTETSVEQMHDINKEAAIIALVLENPHTTRLK